MKFITSYDYHLQNIVIFYVRILYAYINNIYALCWAYLKYFDNELYMSNNFQYVFYMYIYNIIVNKIIFIGNICCARPYKCIIPNKHHSDKQYVRTSCENRSIGMLQQLVENCATWVSLLRVS